MIILLYPCVCFEIYWALYAEISLRSHGQGLLVVRWRDYFKLQYLSCDFIT